MGLREDILKLNREATPECQIVGRNLVDVGTLAEAVGVQLGSRNLRALTAVFMNSKMDKRQQMSDWERRPLSTEQV